MNRYIFAVLLLATPIYAQDPEDLLKQDWAKPGDSSSQVNPGVKSVWDDWVQTKPQDTPNWTFPTNGPYQRKTPGEKGNPACTPKFETAGPDCRTIADKYEAFHMSIFYQAIKCRATPYPKGVMKDPTDQDFANSGIYIFDRYEVQIIDPYQFDQVSKKETCSKEELKKEGCEKEDIKGVGKGKPIKCDCRIKDKEGNVVPDNRTMNVPGSLYGVAIPSGKYLNEANDTGMWNLLEIDFCPPVLDDKGNITTPAKIRTKLNTKEIFSGPIVDKDNKPLKGTGSKGKLDARDKGAIFLQSHWGSQVVFYKPEITAQKCNLE